MDTKQLSEFLKWYYWLLSDAGWEWEKKQMIEASKDFQFVPKERNRVRR